MSAQPTVQSAPLTNADAVVIGAGPVGLWQVFQLGLQGLRVHLLDALPGPGGQCAQLYGDKTLYDIPGLPRCTGDELSARLWQQIQPFAPVAHWGQRVQTLQPAADKGYTLGMDSGLVLHTRTVFIAAGAGAFVPRTLKLPGAEALTNQQLFHHPLTQPAPQLQAPVLVLGADHLALTFALQCPVGPVTLSHRRAVFDAAPALRHALDQAVEQGRVRLCIGLPKALHSNADGRLTAVDIASADGAVHTVEAVQVHAFLGVSPQLGALGNWGLEGGSKSIAVEPASCATALPGVYAVGDVCQYPGKKKLIVCGFHEATMAAFAAAQYLFPAEHRPLEYTSSSSRLHALLGVA